MLWRTQVIKNNKDFLDQSLDEIKLLRYINTVGDADGHNVLILYEYFYHKEHLILVTEVRAARWTRAACGAVDHQILWVLLLCVCSC